MPTPAAPFRWPDRPRCRRCGAAHHARGLCRACYRRLIEKPNARRGGRKP
jgi:hypothetical protein